MKRGRTAAYMKKLRKKYRLGEFKTRRTTKNPRKRPRSTTAKRKRPSQVVRSFSPQFGL